MSTLAEIEQAVEMLPRRQQQILLRHLTAKLSHAGQPRRVARAKQWPVPPPVVSKAESRRVERRIEKEFGRVEAENWK